MEYKNSRYWAGKECTVGGSVGDKGLSMRRCNHCSLSLLALEAERDIQCVRFLYPTLASPFPQVKKVVRD